MVSLEGTIFSDRHSGSCWTRWTPGGRGKVFFWLAVSRDLAGDGFDLLLCAVEPKTAPEIRVLEAELRAGRTVHLNAFARQLAKDPTEQSSSVIFIAETCGLDGAAAVDVHRVGNMRKKCAHGKMAAAGDVEPEFELQQSLETSKS